MTVAVQHETDFRHRDRRGAAAFAVVHGTGETDLDAIARYYVHHDDGVAPHYVIDYDGTYHQFVDEADVAHHVGYGDARPELYRAGWEVWSRRIKARPWKVDGAYSGYATWRERWPGAASPCDLAPGPLLNVNARSIGIELRSPHHRQAKIYYPTQYAALAVLLRNLAAVHGFALTRATILGHYDCDPIGRATTRGDYDPGALFDWPWLMAAVTTPAPIA